LYPNPFTDEINISRDGVCPVLEIKSIRITNIAGQRVKEVEFTGKSIITGNLASGVYFVEIENIGGNKTAYKMIKK
jgi:hypothetical protein